MTQNPTLKATPTPFNEFLYWLAGGVLLMALGYCAQTIEQYKETNFVSTTGEVVGSSVYPSSRMSNTYGSTLQHVYRIKFSVDGRQLYFADSYSDQGINQFGVGENKMVDVWYDPKNPATSAEVSRGFSRRHSFYFFCCGGVMILLPLGQLCFSLKPRSS
jgi:Protein of unknown function (DUF3592)